MERDELREEKMEDEQEGRQATGNQPLDERYQ